MSQPQVIFCGRSAAWATALARQLPAAMRLRQTRGLGECTAELAGAPTSFVALQVTTTNLPGVLRWLAQLSKRYPQACAIVLADRGLESWEWALREAGAIHFTTSPRELEGIGQSVRNHVACVPQSKATFLQQVWDALPWNGTVGA